MLQKTLSQEYQDKGYKKFRFVLLSSEEEIIREVKAKIESSGLFCPTNSALGKVIDIVTSEQKFWNQDFKKTLYDLKTIAYASKQRKTYRCCDISCDFRTEQAYNLEKLKNKLLKIEDEELKGIVKMKTTLLQVILHFFKKHRDILIDRIIPFNFEFKSKFLLHKNREFLNSKIDITDLESNNEYLEFFENTTTNSNKNQKWGYETIKVPSTWIKNNVYKLDISKESLENEFINIFNKNENLTDVLNLITRFDLKVPTDRNIQTQENLYNVEKSEIVVHISPKVTELAYKITFLLNKFYDSNFQKRTVIRVLILYWIYTEKDIIN